MRYLKHVESEGHPYLVTTVTNKREKLFENADAARFLVTVLEYFKFVFDYKIYAYVIMPDHFHMIIIAKSKEELAKIMNEIKGNFSRRFNKKMGRKGAIWQRRYFESVIRSKRKLLMKIDYLHNNPVRAGLVKTPGEYEFSSYNQWLREGTSSLIDRNIF